MLIPLMFLIGFFVSIICAVMIPASYDDEWFTLGDYYEECPECPECPEKFGVVECVSKMVKEGKLKPYDNVKVIIIKEDEQ